MYEYNATVIRVVDGDTLHAHVDLGLDVGINLTLRLAAIDAPEHGTPEGEAATAYLRTLITEGQSIVIQTIKDRREKYGRYLATVWPDAGMVSSVNIMMVEAGHAKPYSGGQR